MCAHHAILKNDYTGLYDRGICLTPTQWSHYIATYEELLCTDGKCSQRQLSKHLKFFKFLARRAIKCFEKVTTIPPIGNRGHVFKGIGKLTGMTMTHHVYIYDVYTYDQSIDAIKWVLQRSRAKVRV